MTSFVEGAEAFHTVGQTIVGVLAVAGPPTVEVTQGCWEEGFPFPLVLVVFGSVVAFARKDSYFD